MQGLQQRAFRQNGDDVKGNETCNEEGLFVTPSFSTWLSLDATGNPDQLSPQIPLDHRP
jgi:hypothetical protein